MSTSDSEYMVPEVSVYNLDPGGSYVGPARDEESRNGGTLSASIVA